MWNQEKLPLVSATALQKRLPFAISIGEISNYIGNFSLSLSSIPTTNRSKYILHAIIKELLILEQISVKEDSFTIPEYIERTCANATESCMIALDGISLPDYCTIKGKKGELLATLIQIHPINHVVNGTCTLDFGLSEKQTIHLFPQMLIRVPTPISADLTLVIRINTGTSHCKTDQAISIEKSSLGLIIDTRESDVLLNSNPVRAKQFAIEWMQSFDIPTSDI